jgi:oligoribonuclease
MTQHLNPDEHLLLIDLETTGLVPSEEKILEVGLVVVTLDFRTVAQFHGLILPDGFDPDDDLDENVRQMHERSRLLDELEASGRDLDIVEEELNEWYDDLFGDAEMPLVGSSVHFDKGFITEHFVDFPDRIHYRIIDFSSVKELCRRYNPDLYAKLPVAKKLHRAIPDLNDTISEARFYVDNFLFTTRPEL